MDLRTDQSNIYSMSGKKYLFPNAPLVVNGCEFSDKFFLVLPTITIVGPATKYWVSPAPTNSCRISSNCDMEPNLPDNDNEVRNEHEIGNLLEQYMQNAIEMNACYPRRDSSDSSGSAPERPRSAVEMDEDFGKIDAETGTVSMLYKCQSHNAKKLCIYDAVYKLGRNEHEIYDIGGTYTGEERDLWFYFSTAVCPGNNYLLNLFVHNRRPGNFTITVSGSNKLVNNYDSKESYLPPPSEKHAFKSFKCDETHFIKTFCFHTTDLVQVGHRTLCIGININMDPKDDSLLNSDVLNRIKLSYDFGPLLMKPENSDFILYSASRTPYKTHRIVLAAHSPVLRDVIERSKSNSELIDISDEDMKLLLEFLYTGMIKNVLKQDCFRLLEIATRFQLDNMMLLIEAQINTDTAITIALFSEKHKLDKIQSKVFDYIGNNMEVFNSDGWRNLNDKELSKKLLQYIHTWNLKRFAYYTCT